VLVAVCSFPSLNGLAAEQNAPEPPNPTAPVPPGEIPLADIAAQATEMAKLLSALTTAAAPGTAIDNIANSLPELSKALDEQIAATQTALEGEPTLEMLQTMQQQWQGRQVETTPWLNTLTQQATKLQDGLNQLAKLQQTWDSTRKLARESAVPAPIFEQIDATLSAIVEAQKKLQGARSAILDLQSRVAQEVTKCTAALTQIGEFQQKAVAGIFAPDAAPIWRIDLWVDAVAELRDHVRKVGLAHRSDLVKYFSEPSKGVMQHVAFLLVLVLLFTTARRRISAWSEAAGTPIAPALAVFERPYAAALATVLVLATSPFFQMPIAVRQTLIMVAIVPLIRIVLPVVSPSVAPAIYALGFLFIIDTLRQAFTGIRVVGQAIMVAETLVAILVLLWLRRHFRRFLAENAQSPHLVLLKLARYLLIIVLTISLFAGASGYVRLARLLTPGVLVGGVLALATIAYLRVGAGVIALAFLVWPLRLLKMVQNNRELLARRIYACLVFMAIMGWSVRYLGYLGLLDPVWSLGQALLESKVERGTISISVGHILEFFLVVAASYLLSRFLRFALQEDVYPRIHLAPGLSYAVSSLLNYILLALGFVAGLGVLGVDFSKVSIMAGAFGVGIGFGLQSIVNNFVSGLILLFERPVHVGDMVQVSNVQGRVQRIGIRASVIRTLQGAEIIVPNAQLISEQVTNWTLSDQLRRIDLPVGVSYGTAPKEMIELLEGVARAHPRVLTNPAPRALFMSYGDSSINFELRAWSEYSSWQQVHSDLTVAVYDALYAAGITIPFPQRDVHVVRDSAANEKNSPVEAFGRAKKGDR
jgi:X-X-X-Leu-X-X-Gly heptad repeat protein